MALFRASRRTGVTRYPALWSGDFPHSTATFRVRTARLSSLLSTCQYSMACGATQPLGIPIRRQYCRDSRRIEQTVLARGKCIGAIATSREGRYPERLKGPCSNALLRLYGDSFRPLRPFPRDACKNGFRIGKERLRAASMSDSAKENGHRLFFLLYRSVERLPKLPVCRRAARRRERVDENQQFRCFVTDATDLLRPAESGLAFGIPRGPVRMWGGLMPQSQPNGLHRICQCQHNALWSRMFYVCLMT